MKTLSHRRPSWQAAFSLIELIIVISIIAILASLIFPVTKIIAKKRMLSVARTELVQLETAIESYKAKQGHYPPDNPGDPVVTPLYFELEGTVVTNNFYVTLDGSGSIAVSDFGTVYGANVNAFMNSISSHPESDEVVAPKNFLTGLKPTQFGEISAAMPQTRLLACSVRWVPNSAHPSPVTGNPELNPWRYVSTTPTNNPHSYDLWVDLTIGSKIYRVSNWSKTEQEF
jgi:prepilin-type N-terminal cleavage/methylation domain-containing protein